MGFHYILLTNQHRNLVKSLPSGGSVETNTNWKGLCCGWTCARAPHTLKQHVYLLTY